MKTRAARWLLGAALLAVLACGDRELTATEPLDASTQGAATSVDAKSEHAAHLHRELPGDALPGLSLYQLEGAWSTASGASQELSALRGAPVLLLLFYGSCDSACPVLVHDLERIAAQLGPASEVRFALVSFDPERDTPERLAAFASAHRLELPRWTLLHGPEDQVRELAAAVGVRYRPSGDGQFSHTMRIVLLDRSGVPVAHWDGLTRPIEPIAQRASELAKVR